MHRPTTEITATLIRLFVLLVTAYFSANAVGRWMRYVIFHGHTYGWPQPEIHEYLLLILISTVPFAVLGVLVCISFERLIRSARGLFFATIVLYLLILIAELDFSWYHMSKRHIGRSEVEIFLLGDWQHHMGLRSSDALRFLKISLFHALSFFLIFTFSVRVKAKWITSRFLRVKAFLFALSILFLFDIIMTGREITQGNKQVMRLSAMHPLRLSKTDNLYAFVTGRNAFLTRVNELYRKAGTLDPRFQDNPVTTSTPGVLPTKYNVVILAIEGLSERYVGQLTSLDSVRSNALTGANHYSTGNVTHYGILGLIHGLPMTFYGGSQRPQSKFIELFNRAGYTTRRFGTDVTAFGEIDHYTANFSMPTMEPKAADAEIIPELRNYLADRSSKRLAVVYYSESHWPYKHDKRFSRFQPEVPDDFNYARPDLTNFKNEIRNRYKNSMDQLDAWLKDFLDAIDLNETILVITGDHGQEMLEKNRIAHTGGLWEGQIRTPLIVHVPGAGSTQVNAITSHAHIMPALSRWLGLSNTEEEQVARPLEESHAVASHNNHTSRPKEWVIVFESHKIHFEFSSNGQIEIKSIADRDDNAIFDLTILSDPRFIGSLRRLKSLEKEALAQEGPIADAAVQR